MKRIFFILFLLPLSLSAQVVEDVDFGDEEDKSELKSQEEIWGGHPEIYPRYPGGEDSLFAFLAKSLDYSCMDTCGMGRVYVQFTIDTTGNVTNVKTPRPFCEQCDEEARRIVSIMPKWKIGRAHV